MRSIKHTTVCGVVFLFACLISGDSYGDDSLDKYRLNPVPQSLENVRTVHPRIFITQSRIAELRQQIATTHRAVWEETKRQADRAVKSGPPEYVGNGDGVGRWGFEQLWQRNVGNYLSTLAMVWVVTEDRKYLDSIREWALASCGYKTWGGLGWADGIDLAASHQLLGLGLVYDWCYHALDDETKRVIRETLVRRTSRMVSTITTDDVWWHRADIKDRVWYKWQNAYLQNHLWVNMCGVAVAGFALYGEEEASEAWIGLALDKFSHTMKVLGDDGASHEGVQYWDYGVENLLKFMYLSRDLLEIDMFGNEWFLNTAKYRMHLSLPVNGWTRYGNVIDIGDCSRGSWYSDYNLRALAHEYSDAHAQWFAGKIDKAKDDSPRLRWLNLIWYDPAVPEKAPDDLPTFHHFTDTGIISARSGWTGDESLLVYKCGPYIGHKALRELPYDPSSAHHVHPDANHFVLFGEGEFLIRDDGYHVKWTDQHNTLLVDGKGQLGEGGLWFDGSVLHDQADQPRIVKAVSTPGLDHICGDASAAYPGKLGVERFTRHILFVKPDILIVADDIGVDRIRDLELRFHPEQQTVTNSSGTLVFQGRKSRLHIEPLTTDGVRVGAEKMSAELDSGEMDMMMTVRLKATKKNWKNAIAFSWAGKSDKPQKVTIHKDDTLWRFDTSHGTVLLNWETGKAELR